MFGAHSNGERLDQSGLIQNLVVTMVRLVIDLQLQAVMDNGDKE